MHINMYLINYFSDDKHLSGPQNLALFNWQLMSINTPLVLQCSVILLRWDFISKTIYLEQYIFSVECNWILKINVFF